MGSVTHGHVAFSTNEQFAGLYAVDRAGRRCQGHGLEDFWAVTHDGDTADLQAQTTLLLRGSKQAGVFAAIALRVLLHSPLGAAKYADLKRILRRDKAAVIATTAHDGWSCGGWNRGGER